MDRKTREELNKLSKEVFGTTSRWQKIVNKGIAQPYEMDREVMVPTSKGIVKKTFTSKKSVVTYSTVDEVRKLMLDILETRKGNSPQPTQVNLPVYPLADGDTLPGGATVQVYGSNKDTTIE